MQEIECKKCGLIEEPNISEGIGPHAYKANCVGCGTFNKWLSKLDVENISEVDLLNKKESAEWAAIMAAKAGNINEFYKNINLRNKYYERL